jgi:hypothetical protein
MGWKKFGRKLSWPNFRSHWLDAEEYKEKPRTQPGRNLNQERFEYSWYDIVTSFPEETVYNYLGNIITTISDNRTPS